MRRGKAERSKDAPAGLVAHNIEWRPPAQCKEESVNAAAEEELCFTNEVDRAREAKAQMRREAEALERILKEKEARVAQLRAHGPPPPMIPTVAKVSPCGHGSVSHRNRITMGSARVKPSQAPHTHHSNPLALPTDEADVRRAYSIGGQRQRTGY